MAMTAEEKARKKKQLEKEYAAEAKKRGPKVSESLKVGAKQAIKGAARFLGGGGMADKARTALAEGKKKTREEIERQTK